MPLGELIGFYVNYFLDKTVVIGVSQKAIDKIPDIHIEEASFDQDSCPICIEYFDENEKVIKLKCNHIFHRECVTPWLKMNATCPDCRVNILDLES